MKKKIERIAIAGIITFLASVFVCEIMFCHNSVEVRQLKYTIIFLIPLLLPFSEVAHAISYTKYLNGTMTITYDNGTTVTPPPGSALYKAHNQKSLN